jgi:putative DNA primase/helicase
MPFHVQIPPNERDEHLAEKLAAEASGILNWMLSGLASWLADGRKMDEPREVRDAVGGYRSDSDTFGAFLHDAVVNNDAAKVAVHEIYKAYKRWADDNGMTFAMTKIEFGKRMAERGYSSKPNNGIRYIVGCSLATADADEPLTATVDERMF